MIAPVGRRGGFGPYVEGDGNLRLLLDVDWWDRHMPKRGYHDPYVLRVVYLDRETGLEHETGIYDAWDDIHVDWPEPAGPAKVLQNYFYAYHNCPCHRKQDLSNLGVDIDNECEGRRVAVVRIFAPSHSELTLYSETIEVDALLATLGRLGGRVDQF